MDYYTEPSRKIPVQGRYDVIVVGGGPAGIMAAVSARISGAEDVLLVERYGFLGGMLTAGSVLNIRTFNDKDGNLVIAGLPLEFVSKLKEHNGAFYDPRKDSCVRHNPEITKHIAEIFCLEHEVELLYHTYIVGTIVEGDLLKGVIVENKSGRQAFLGKTVVDATGDGDVAAYSDAPYMKGGENGELQPMTSAFVLGGVSDAVWPQIERPNYYSSDIIQKHKQLYSEGKYPINRKDLALFPFHRKGEVYANITRVPGDGTNVEDLTRAEIEGRRQIRGVLEYLRENIPGFGDVYLLYTGSQVGLRETRRIRGDYILTAEDVLETRDFADTIARGSYYIDIHHVNEETTAIHLQPGTSYGIPYRCLLPQKPEKLLVAGRCISTSHEAHGSTRVMATCMATGHAAGAAAGLSAVHDVNPRELDPAELQRVLKEQDAVL